MKLGQSGGGISGPKQRVTGKIIAVSRGGWVAQVVVI
jgi:hypothetical protein